MRAVSNTMIQSGKPMDFPNNYAPSKSLNGRNNVIHSNIKTHTNAADIHSNIFMFYSLLFIAEKYSRFV